MGFWDFFQIFLVFPASDFVILRFFSDFWDFLGDFGTFLEILGLFFRILGLF